MRRLRFISDGHMRATAHAVSLCAIAHALLRILEIRMFHGVDLNAAGALSCHTVSAHVQVPSCHCTAPAGAARGTVLFHCR